jgi:hypothetical protein
MNTVRATVIFLLFGPVGLITAQSPNGTIAGVITDSSGGAVADAEVSITNQGTRQVRDINDLGNRRIQRIGVTAR